MKTLREKGCGGDVENLWRTHIYNMLLEPPAAKYVTACFFNVTTNVRAPHSYGQFRSSLYNLFRGYDTRYHQPPYTIQYAAPCTGNRKTHVQVMQVPMWSAKCTLGCLKQKRIIFIHMGTSPYTVAVNIYPTKPNVAQLLKLQRSLFHLLNVLYTNVYTRTPGIERNSLIHWSTELNCIRSVRLCVGMFVYNTFDIFIPYGMRRNGKSNGADGTSALPSLLSSCTIDSASSVPAR